MIDIRFEIGGRTVNPNNIKDVFERLLVTGLTNALREKYGAIRHPTTGEFPTVVVRGTDLSNVSFHIEGSPELLALVKERNQSEDNSENGDTAPLTPKVFLCYASEDLTLAKHIAENLQAKNIDTWWDKWCIYSGDSLRQKIDEGLTECTHFVVLLTPDSINKPWVNQEIDAAFVRKVQNQCKFIPLRHRLPITALSPLLSSMYSPEISGEGDEITQLINDIYGINRKPSLGAAPDAIITANKTQTGYSPAATAIAKFFVENTENAEFADPQIRLEDLAAQVGLTVEDTKDALYELRGLFRESLNRILVESSLFAEFDKFWKEWNPAEDGLKLATDIVNDPAFPASSKEIAQRYGWDARRLNSAIAYLVDRNLVHNKQTLGSPPFIAIRVMGNDHTRRFVKSRAL